MPDRDSDWLSHADERAAQRQRSVREQIERDAQAAEAQARLRAREAREGTAPFEPTPAERSRAEAEVRRAEARARRAAISDPLAGVDIPPALADYAAHRELELHDEPCSDCGGRQWKLILDAGTFRVHDDGENDCPPT